MGFFSRRPKHVQVVFHDLAEQGPDDRRRSGIPYTYAWGFRSRPSVDEWVWVQGSDGPATARIVELGQGKYTGHSRPVLSRVTQHELAQFEQLREHESRMLKEGQNIWLEMARQRAGLPALHAVPASVPKPYEPIPAVKGRVIGEKARDRGRVWWKLYNLALERQLPDTEVARFKEIADGWYDRSRMKDPSE